MKKLSGRSFLSFRTALSRARPPLRRLVPVLPVLLLFTLAAGCGHMESPSDPGRPAAAFIPPDQPAIEEVTLVRDIGGGDYSRLPEGAVNVFSTEDTGVVAHVRYADLAGAHNFRWKWYAPDGSLYVDSGQHEIAPPAGRYIEQGATWHRLSVENETAMRLPGTWRVEVLLNDRPVQTRQFHIEKPALDIAVAPGSRISRPDAVAVVIGNRTYAHQDIPEVDFAHQDAERIRQYFVNTLGLRPGNVIFKTDATKIDFEELFGVVGNHRGRLYDYVKPDRSEVFIYYSGHGAPDPNTRQGYFVPADCRPERISLTGYSLDLFYENLSRIPSTQNLVILDACFSGQTPGGRMLLKDASPIAVNLRNPIIGDGRTMVLASARGNQVSSWYNEKNHSLFTYFFLRALHGEADSNNDNRITIQEVYEYVSDRAEGVPYWVRRLHGNRDQNPMLMGLGDTDYVLVKY